MVLACRQRRILRIVAFIGVACVIFLCFQLFLVGFLDHDAHQELQHGAQPKVSLDSDELRVIDVPNGRTTEYLLQLQHKRKSDCSSHNCSVAAKSTVRVISKNNILLNTTQVSSRFFLNDSHTDNSIKLSQYESVWQFLEHSFSRPLVLEKGIVAHSTRGVNRRWQYLYEAGDQMQFTCILSQVCLFCLFNCLLHLVLYKSFACLLNLPTSLLSSFLIYSLTDFFSYLPTARIGLFHF